MDAPIPPPLPSAAPPLPPAPQQTSALAVVSVVVAGLGLLLSIVPLISPFFAVPAVVCGHLALSSIKRSRGALTGRGAAIAGLCLGYLSICLFVAGVALLGGVLAKAFKDRASGKVVDSSAAMFDLAKTPLPNFPDLPAFQPIADSPVRAAAVDFAPANPGPRPPAGSQMKLHVYLPPGKHAPRSLACVLVPPAGTNMLVGNDLDDLDDETYDDETRPYAEAGVVAIQYSLDGAHDEDAKGAAQGWDKAYQAFRAAGAGTVNARNALEFARRRLPMVDPDRIFSAGHSSAGTVSLLFGASEPRLRGCIAYAPGIDVEEHLKELLGTPMISTVFPNVRGFLLHASPKNQVQRITPPVFLFQAKDDSKAPYARTTRFVEKLKATNPRVTLVTVETGDHYLPMIEEGIPAAIQWMKTITSPAPAPLEALPDSD